MEQKKEYAEGISKIDAERKLDGMLFQLNFTENAKKKVKEKFNTEPIKVYNGVRSQYVTMLSSIGGK